MKKIISILALAAVLTLGACSGDEQLSFNPTDDAAAFNKELLKAVDDAKPADAAAVDSLQAQVDNMANAYINFYTSRAAKIDNDSLKQVYTLQIDTLKTELTKGKKQVDDAIAKKRAELNPPTEPSIEQAAESADKK